MTPEKNAGAPVAPGTPAAQTAVKEPQDMSTIPKHPLQLEHGDVIVEHPVTDKPGPWTVAGQPVRWDGIAEVDVTRDGVADVLVIDQHATVTVKTTPRQDLIAGLRAAADYIEAHPGLPIGEHDVVTVQYSAQAYVEGWPQAVERINLAAAHLGLIDVVEDDERYQVERYFGPLVRYLALATKDDETAEETA